MNEIKKYRFKIAVIGDSEVGKTSLMKKFTRSSFTEDYAKTLGARSSRYDMEIDGNPVRLMFWLIAAEDDFLFLRPGRCSHPPRCSSWHKILRSESVGQTRFFFSQILP